MARSGGGVYSKPSGTTPVNGDLVDAVPYNLLMDDIAADLNLPRPIVAGGTGASSAATALAALGGAAKSANLSDLASSSTARTNLGLVPQTSATDTTAARLLTVGAFGLGEIGDVATLTNIDATTTAAGNYKYTTGATGTFPVGVTAAAGGKIGILRIASNSAWETLQPNDSSDLFYRRLSGTWQPWRQSISILDSTVANGDMLVRVGGAWVRLPEGTVGQVLRGTATGLAPAWTDPLSAATSQATTSGTAFDFTGIPSWVTRITIEFFNVSLSGTDNVLVQVGTSGGVVSTGYSSVSSTVAGGSTASDGSTAGMIVRGGEANDAISGQMTINLEQSGSWSSSHVISRGLITVGVSMGGGRITPGGAITRIRVTRTGTNTFDSGAVNIKWE